MLPEWAELLRDECVAAGVAYFFKQWGGRSKPDANPLLDGQEWREMPA